MRRTPAAAVVLITLITGCQCSSPSPQPDATRQATPTTTPAKPLPPATPATAEPLGPAPWLRMAVMPDRRSLAVTTPTEIVLLGLPDRDRRWARPAPAPPHLLAVASDGRVAVLGGHPAAAHLLVLEPTTGEPASDDRFPPPAVPTALLPAPGDPAGWWVRNEDSTWLATPGAESLQRVEDDPRLEYLDLVVGQDLGGLWVPTDGGVASLDTPWRADTGCRPRTFTVSPSLSRAVVACEQRLLFADLLTSEVVARRDLDAPPTALQLLAPDRVLVRTDAPPRVGWLGAAPGPDDTWTALPARWERLAWSADGTRATAEGPAGARLVLDLASGEVVCDHTRPDVPACQVALGSPPTDRQLVAEGPHLHVVDVATDTVTAVLDLGEDLAGVPLALSPDGATVLLGGGPTGLRRLVLP